jgi:hypothetical protein
MKLISSNKIGIQSGTFTMFSDFDKAGEVLVGTGSRERHKRITFKEKFVSPPSVTLNISLWDVHSDTNFRMKLLAIDITQTGFTASFETRDDTRIARMHITWQAIGEAIDPDEIWDV